MKTKTVLVAICLLVIGLRAEAVLIDRGNDLIYDDVLDITWAPADLFLSGTWDEAVAWADALVYQGFDDWRLASMTVAGGLPTGTSAGGIVYCPGDTEQACRDNELAYMYFYNLAGTLGDDLTGNHGLFTNIGTTYRSGTEDAMLPDFAWNFRFTDGGQGTDLKDIIRPGSDAAGWAVRDGDVVSVPLPGTELLVTLGLMGLSAGRRLW
jgi:hypothetical protein